LKAIILAAGRGSRMNDLTNDRPKCLIKHKGRELVNWQLDALRESGISDIAIVTGYKRELLSGLGLHEFYNSRWSKTQMVSSLSCAASWLINDNCIVTYSDIFYSSNAITSLINSNADIAITYDPNWHNLWINRFSDPLLDAETFRFDTNNNLIEIGNKPTCANDIQGQYMGLLRISPKGWATIVLILQKLSNIASSNIHLTQVLQLIVESELLKIQAIPYFGTWGEVDTPSDLLLYQKDE